MNKLDEAIGKNIRTLRMAKGWTQIELGQKLGITFQQIQKYEAGSNSLNVNKLVTLAGLFDCPVATLIGLPTCADGEIIFYSPGGRNSKRIAQLVRDYLAIESPDIQDYLCGLVRAVAAVAVERQEQARDAR